MAVSSATSQKHLHMSFADEHGRAALSPVPFACTRDCPVRKACRATKLQKYTSSSVEQVGTISDRIPPCTVQRPRCPVVVSISPTYSLDTRGGPNADPSPPGFFSCMLLVRCENRSRHGIHSVYRTSKADAGPRGFSLSTLCITCGNYSRNECYSALVIHALSGWRNA